uniref:Iron complex transport system ATP-binding protein n=1 Tax=Candidatus Kentrum sp. FM TaxID=2126340 RepID=A0A450WPL1_9GAMM|nr:MAG: iron complex transport system ATP-binding protein [Candidatus Kentron sp. FM]VFJ72621.1 MAG: iron complex transport system ATP-binding protein [Candidatus Kentron sp. FM]VFK18981.1 MAG: iron complex transport system ATP-binding protein [Candidatus Kentron sp. FM]
MNEYGVNELTGEGLRVVLAGKTVLREVDVTIHPGYLTGILGPNGAGKSTLARALLGYLPLASGRVMLGGREIESYSGGERARRIGYLAQGHIVHWPLLVEKVVELGRMAHRRGGWAGAEADRRAVERALERAGVAHLRGRTMDTLSGGERARVLLARVLAGEPDILLADEPLTGLDPAYQLRILALLREFADQGLAVAIVLHDITLAARFCARLVLLRDGALLAKGTPGQVLTDAYLALAFGIEARRADIAGEPVLVPWQIMTGPEAEAAAGGTAKQGDFRN